MGSTVDRNGNLVQEGDRALLVSIHPSVLASLPDDERQKVTFMEGKALEVYEVDERGQAWVEMKWQIAPNQMKIHMLGLMPEDMERVN